MADPHVLIAGQTGRALAQSARACGYAPLVADLFADDDTRAAAEAAIAVDALDERSLLPALGRLARGRRPLGVVCAAGFEDRPDLLGLIARRYRLIGNNQACVRAVKDPQLFAAACARLDLPHPPIRLGAAPDDGWLCKQIGGAGGQHIAAAAAHVAAPAGYYLQRRVPGTPVAALFLADGTHARMLGLSRQWTDPAPDEPWRFGGAVQPAHVPDAMDAALRQGLDGLVRTFGLRGLNSADLLVHEGGFFLLEVNPRPGATLDLHPTRGLFGLHVAACDGRLPAALPGAAGASASAIVYAGRTVTLPPDFAWPAWASDRQRSGVAVEAGQPLCSVQATAADPDEAVAALRRRAATITAAVEDVPCPSA